TEHRVAARVAILDVKYRVLARLLDHLGEIKIEHSVVLAVEHHEANGILANLVDHFTQGNKVAGPLRHLHRLAVTQQLDKLDDLHIERGLARGDGLDRRLHALDITTVISAPDIDEVAKAAVEFVAMVGDVRCKIGVGTVGLDQRPGAVVAKGGGAKQRLLAILVILDRSTLWRRQTALVDVALGTKEVDGLGHAIISGFDQGTLGKEHVLPDSQR